LAFFLLDQNLKHLSYKLSKFHQQGLKLSRKENYFPLDEKEVEEKFFVNLKFINLSSREIDNVKKFFKTFFNEPDFSLLR
jgi:hypothetical protein